MVFQLVSGKMNKLVTVINKEVIKEFKGREDITLLYPLQDYCVGYEVTFAIDEIDEFLLINRILNDSDLDKLERILVESNIKGIVFDDLGVLDVIKNMNITKILLLDHISNSSISINYYLDYVDSVVVSSDLSKEEILNIFANCKKKLVLYGFGLKGLMYSRRLLLSNYEEFHGLEKDNTMEAAINDKEFKIWENEYGTKFYGKKYYDALELTDVHNLLYCWYDGVFLSTEELKRVVFNNDTTGILTSRYFLDKKTVFKVGDLDD